MSRYLLVGLWLCLFMAGPARAADDGAARLDRFFHGLKTLSADFHQTLVDSHGAVREQAGGKLWISRPDRFRWEYDKPYRQIIVADGVNLWTYDADLQQATVKPLSETLAGTPATLLSSQQPPATLFKIRDGGRRDGDLWVDLTPRSKDSQYERIRLGFDGADLDRMELVDAFGQTTRFRFTHVRRNPEVAARRFRFSPPQGADVIGRPRPVTR